ncbi:acyl-ACP--UDP-N-acetylglucosamine O-acyltransferase [bacterium]|nr:acyl-ACP--UDP-N-acetylglucosamine O-acyltransferase [bacterium]
MAVEIHPTAIVEAGVDLGEGVVIGPYCIVKSGAKIGECTSLISSVRIEGTTEIGKNCQIHHCACLGDDPQDYKYAGDETYLKIGDNNIIREFVTMHKATGKGNSTIVGSNCYIMAYCHVAHNCILKDNIILANGVNMGGYTEIDEHTMIGGMVAIHQFVKIGAQVMVGGGFRVGKDVAPYILVGGYPAKPYGLNIVGLRRRSFPKETIRILKKAYNFLFNSPLNITQALDKIKTELDQTEEIKYLLDFIENRSNRGIMR